MINEENEMLQFYNRFKTNLESACELMIDKKFYSTSSTGKEFNDHVLKLSAIANEAKKITLLNFDHLKYLERTFNNVMPAIYGFNFPLKRKTLNIDAVFSIFKNPIHQSYDYFRALFFNNDYAFGIHSNGMPFFMSVFEYGLFKNLTTISNKEFELVPNENNLSFTNDFLRLIPRVESDKIFSDSEMEIVFSCYYNDYFKSPKNSSLDKIFIKIVTKDYNKFYFGVEYSFREFKKPLTNYYVIV